MCELSVYVDALVPMSKDMLSALTEFEFTMIGRGRTTTTHDEIEKFLDEVDPDLSKNFVPFFMLSTRDS